MSMAKKHHGGRSIRVEPPGGQRGPPYQGLDEHQVDDPQGFVCNDPGGQQGPPDAQTRRQSKSLLCHAIQARIDYRELAAAQDVDQEIQDYQTAVTNLKFEDLPFADGACTVICNVSMGSPRQVVLAGWRQNVFDTIHALSHPEARTTRKLISQRFVWHGLNKQVTIWAKTCLSCKRSKVHTHVKAPFKTFEPTHRSLGHVHIDIIGLSRSLRASSTS